jgi:hypothetical protein
VSGPDDAIDPATARRNRVLAFSLLGVAVAVAGGFLIWWWSVDDVAVDEVATTTSTTLAPADPTTSTSTTTAATTSTSSPAPRTTGPSPGVSQRISFRSIGGFQIGDEAPRPTESEFEDWKCGYWQPSAGLFAIVTEQEGGVVRVSEIKTDDPAFRTDDDVSVGSDLAALRRVYGDRLVVDRADGWDAPTSGLLGSYNDVAAVREGDRSLTFVLIDDVVTQIELSTADNWGDDEGCV